ncbi:MAG: hypothetical protein ACT6RP_15335, partial [Roseateles sp.]
ALPGCAQVERAQPQTGMPTLWAEVEALDEAALDRQLRRLPVQPVARLQLPSAAPDALPCDDPPLAERLEAGLDLCSRPFAQCARRLGCSECKLLAKLQAWRRGHQLAGLALKPPPTGVPRAGLLALWLSAEPTADNLALLRAHSCVERVISTPATPAWTWRLSVLLRAAPRLAQDQLREIAAQAGLAQPDHCALLQIEQPRDQPLLFLTSDGVPNAA